MKNKKNLLIAQSGGPTTVINATLAGVITKAKNVGFIDDVIGSLNGVKGILEENFIDLKKEKDETIENLKYTNAMALGSVRYKLNKEEDFSKILNVFKKYNIKYFVYIGGNDSMDTANKISIFLKNKNFDCQVIGLPKTVDNDLPHTDHTPGFASSAKFITTSVIETFLDVNIYDIKSVTIMEIMGRNAGWLTASSFLARKANMGPDLVYLPELAFSYEDFKKEVSKLLKTKNNLIVCVSEGIKTKDNKYVQEESSNVDAFGHQQLGGVGLYLANKLKEDLKIKTRAIELSTLQRSAAHCASQTDIDESFKIGKSAIDHFENKDTNIMLGYKRVSSNPYKIEFEKTTLDKIANVEKTVPLDWIISPSKIKEDFYEYISPLVVGETKLNYKEGIPQYSVLKKIKYK